MFQSERKIVVDIFKKDFNVKNGPIFILDTNYYNEILHGVRLKASIRHFLLEIISSGKNKKTAQNSGEMSRKTKSEIFQSLSEHKPRYS